MAPSKTGQISGYLTKMKEPDADLRFMALSDLTNTAIEDPSLFGVDEKLEATTVNEILRLIEDKNSEVKNQAVKCLGQLIKSIKESQLNKAIDTLVRFSDAPDGELRDIAGLALKTVVSELPYDGPLTQKASTTLAPKLLANLQKPDTPPEAIIETLSILSILVSRFPAYLVKAHLNPSPVTAITPLLAHKRPAVRKRAVLALAQFIPIATTSDLGGLVEKTITPTLAGSGVSVEQQGTVVQLVGAIARYAPQQFSGYLDSIVPAVVSVASKDDGDLREGVLQALESLVLRCPTEVMPFLSSIITLGTDLIRYDPNYAADDDEDEDEDMEDADDEDDDLGDDYSDDEDTSYKVRRSATKLLAAIIGTRPELLTTIYRTVSPVLISRFGDREETVRLEIWSTYSLLLRQTGIYGSVPQSREAEALIGTKRKREEDKMEVEETPLNLLQTHTSSFGKALLKQLQPKASATTLQAGFSLLHSLLAVVPGSLANQTTVLTSVISAVFKTASASTASSLHTTIITFLDLFFSTHPASTFSPSLPQWTPPLIASLSEKDPRIAAVAFHAFSTLLEALKPVSSDVDWVDAVYRAALDKLERNETDIIVREKAEETIAELWLCATDLVRAKGGNEWAALRRSGRTEGAVKVVEKVAKGVDQMPDEWTSENIQWVLSVIRKSGRAQKDDAFSCLGALLTKYPSGYPSGLISSVIGLLQPYIALTDLSHLTNALSIINLILRTAPQETFPIVEKELQPSVQQCAVSPLLSGSLLDPVIEYFQLLVLADPPIANRVIPGLTIAWEKGAATSALNTGRCIGAIVQAETSLTAGTISEYVKSIKSKDTSRVVLGLHVLGEVGRFVDMTLQPQVFTDALAQFNSQAADVRAAAAFAVGNIAIGNISTYLPIIMGRIRGDDAARLLALHALKEVVTHCTSQQLEGVAEALWVPLFENPENAEENTRNVAAACIGKITTTQPTTYLPRLRDRLKDPSPAVRSTVVASMRYTLADTPQSYDTHLAPFIVDFLSLVKDQDITVRRLSLSALNAAARHKPRLIRDHLPLLMPLLYQETVLNESLIREVVMGPWKHRVDDGLEARKVAYETMSTILDTCLSSIDLHAFFNRVLQGLRDNSDEIKQLAHVMLVRLSQVAPTTISQRLDEVAPVLEETNVNIEKVRGHKDTVKQDLERVGELQRSTLRAIAALSKISSPAVSPKMERLVETIEKGSLAKEYKEWL